MLSTFIIKKTAEGEFKKIELIKYDDGKVVKREYPINSQIPEEARPVENQELALYKHYFPH